MGFDLFKSKPSNIVWRIKEGDSLPQFLDMIYSSELVADLEEKGPFTVFVPSDEAFDRCPESVMQQLNEAVKDKEKAKEIVENHVLEGEYLLHEIVEQSKLQTVNGKELNIDVNFRINRKYNIDVKYEGAIVKIKVNKVNISYANVPCSNGIIHMIDGVIL